MEAPPDPGPHASASASASAAAPLRAPEVARLREEQEKVTGRVPAPRFRRWSREAPTPRLGRGARTPSPGLGPSVGGRLPRPSPSRPLWAAAPRSGAQLAPTCSREEHGL